MNHSLQNLTTSTIWIISMLLMSFFFLWFSTTSASLEAISFSSTLTSLTLPRRSATSSLYSNKINAATKTVPKTKTGTTGTTPSSSLSYSYRSSFKYSVSLIVSLPIGTPPQTQQMVLDTGSQLSWIQCNQKQPQPPPHTLSAPTGAAATNTTFNPSRSSSFSVLPCNHPICKPRPPDFTLPTSCDHNSLCHYSYFFADGTYAEGNLVREKFTFSSSQATPPLTLGCSSKSSDDKGILGMNLGRLSFPSQAQVSKFSYCVPPRPQPGSSATGAFVLGENPNSGSFQYVPFMRFDRQSQRMPNLDPLAYTVAMQGIKIGGKRLDISAAAFRPDAGGSGQTMVDSGSEFTYLVDDAYNKVKEEVVRLVGPKMKKGYVAEGVLEMCFDQREVAEVRRVMGSMVFEFEKEVEIGAEGEKLLVDMGDGAHCVPVAMSSMLGGAASNIIGNVHQQNMWVEFDLTSRRIGLGRADCTRSS